MQLRIYIEGEPYPHILFPLAFLAVRIHSGHGKVIARMEVINALEETERSIDCTGVPAEYQYIFFHFGWVPEVFVSCRESYIYDFEKNEWLRK